MTSPILRSLTPGATRTATYSLSMYESMVLGRDPNCPIVVDSTHHVGVSRKHVEIRPSDSRTSNGFPQWEVCDLGSSNGTYVNRQRLQGCRLLQVGDTIRLGQNGPEFVFEHPAVLASPMPQVQPIQDNLSITQLIPALAVKKDLLSKAYLIPGVLTVLVIVGLYAWIGEPFLFNTLLGTYLASIAYYFIYRLSGKPKPIWWLVLAGIVTIVLLRSPVLNLFVLVFRHILPGTVSKDAAFIPKLIGMFFGAGLMEELLKALPVFGALWIGRILNLRGVNGLEWEPLDGILLGAASAVGFTLLETLGQYVPSTIGTVAAQAGEGVGELVGIQLLIPRIIGSVAGHMAYSGYFGYFIGLSILVPSKRWKLLGIGYLTSAALHAFWNASTSVPGFVLTAIVGVVSYVFLMGAILKARQLSPTRSQNFATQIRLP